MNWRFRGWPVPRPELAGAPPRRVNGDHHRPAARRPANTSFLVAGIKNQIRIGFLQSPAGELSQLLVQRFTMALMELAEKEYPKSSSVICLTFRVGTSWMYISASAETNAFSLRW
jgi:hypothetical protein